jgi:hypothetical protein
MSTSLIGGRKHVSLWQRGSVGGGGEPDRKHFLEQGEISTNEVATLFDLAKFVYEFKLSSRTNVGGEALGGRIF